MEGVDGTWLYGTAEISNDFVAIFRLSKAGGPCEVLHVFGVGSYPGILVQGRNGVLYGVSSGSPPGGELFKLNPDGSGFAILRPFSCELGNLSGLVIADDGTLYGSSYGWEACTQTPVQASIIKLSLDGTGDTVVRSFSAADVASLSNLLRAKDGTLFAITGDEHGCDWAAVKMNTDGTGYSILGQFSGCAGDPSAPRSLVLAPDGHLYAIASLIRDEDFRGAAVFRLNPEDGSYSILHRFTGSDPDGSDPISLSIGADGALYGLIALGGEDLTPTKPSIFKLNTDGSGYSVLHRGQETGRGPMSLSASQDGALYGLQPGGIVFRLEVASTNYTPLSRFTRSGGDGNLLGDFGNSPGTLLTEMGGRLFGTTSQGGTNDSGTVFTLRSDGTDYKILHDFDGDLDGRSPSPGLLAGTDGALYGTTASGGSTGAGTMFRISADGSSYTVLRSFSAIYPAPRGALVRGTDAGLYGITLTGGDNNAGSVCRLAPDGSEYRVLHSFSMIELDLAYPSELVTTKSGMLYGTTPFGGGANKTGTIFSLSEAGSAYSILHQFDARNEPGGSYPAGGLCQGQDGAFYGTTALGGTDDLGTVFKINADGTGYTVVHSFGGRVGDDRDGLSPGTRLVQGSDTALYGTTSWGGRNGDGTVFRLSPNGSNYIILHHFKLGDGDGVGPVQGLTLATDGALYGASSQGGDLGLGTVFKMTIGAPPNIIRGIEATAFGARLTFFGGAAGQVLEIKATDRAAPAIWRTIGQVEFGIDGKAEFIDFDIPHPARFYETEVPWPF